MFSYSILSFSVGIFLTGIEVIILQAKANNVMAEIVEINLFRQPLIFFLIKRRNDVVRIKNNASAYHPTNEILPQKKMIETIQMNTIRMSV